MLNSIRTRLTIAFLGLAVGPLLIVGLLLTLEAYNVQTQGAIALQREMAAHLSSRVQTLILNLENELHTLIRIEDLLKLGPERQQLILSIFRSRHSAIDVLILLDAGGRVLSYHSRLKLNQDLPLQSQKELESFTVPMSRGITYFGPVRFKELSGEPVMIIAVPIIALDTGKPEGVLVADVRLKEIWDLVASIRPGEKGSSFIVDAENRVIAHSNPSVVLRGTRFDPPGFDGVQMGLSVQESVLVSQVISFGAHQFHIVVEGPVSEALALAINTVRIMLTILVIALLVAGGFGFLTVRRIVRPIEEIAETVRAINAGDLSRRIVVKSRDELGVLADAFNKMTLQLETLINDLGKRVAERTAELTIAKDAAEETRRSAEAANQAKSVFLANMSHELRTPLNAVLGFSQLMTRAPNLTPSQRANLETIGRSGEHLLALINDVLELSRIEAGRVEVQAESFDLWYMLLGLEEMFRLRAETKGLTLVFERGRNVPQYVLTDANKLRQVLINLLGNAVKFTQEGGVTLRVNYGDEDRVSGRLSFEVEDSGPGIAPQEMEAVFDPFVQTESGRKSREGSGLGLPISRHFVRLMGGDMGVESEPGAGTVFRFDVPVQLVAASEVQPVQPTRRVVGLEPGQQAADGTPYRLLVVEDMDSNRQLLLQLLQPLGFDVREAVNGQEAIDIWEQWKPHLIWMDMRMPVLDGYEATKRIRALGTGHSVLGTNFPASGTQHPAPSTQYPVIIALTASSFEEERAVVLQAGCDDYLRKPFREAELFALLSKHLGVRFVYEKEGSKVKGQRSKVEEILTPEMLAALPAEWLTTLKQGAEEADIAMLREVIAQIRERDAALAAALARLVEDFAYEEILATLQHTKKGDAAEEHT